MTSPEHTGVGILGALSLGLHQRLGWAAVVFAGVVSNIPDLDGLPMLIDIVRFESGHRVWGHNFLAIVITSAPIAYIQSRYCIIEIVASRLRMMAPKDVAIPSIEQAKPIRFLTLVCIAFLFQAIHLVCDMAVSGGKGLSDWHVLPFWPFSSKGYVLSLVEWGNPMPTWIMMATLVVVAKRRDFTRLIATVGLMLLCTYMLISGYQLGSL